MLHDTYLATNRAVNIAVATVWMESGVKIQEPGVRIQGVGGEGVFPEEV